MKVVHCKKERYTKYIGRPSPLGNPFIIGKDGDRHDVIRKFRDYAINSPEIKYEITKLKETDILGCWCHPQPCHGDIIIEIYNNHL